MRKILSFLPFFRPVPPLVAILHLHGVIAAQARMGRSLELSRLEETLDQAFAIKGLKAVAISINSPGGSPVQAGLIHDRIRSLAAEKSLPVYTFAEDVAASGGYMLLLAGDEVYVHPSSIVGSIGVISAGFGFVEALEKLGVERRVHTAGTRKGMLDSFSPEQPEDVARLKDLQRDIHQLFKDMLIERRGAKLVGPPDELFSGDIWLGRKAVDYGLVDGLGELRSVMKAKYGTEVKFKVLGRERGWLRGRLGLGAKANLATELVDAVETRTVWSRWGL